MCLAHAFEHSDKDTPFDLSEAIILSSRAVELFGKAKIADINPSKIWRVDEPTKTIGFNEVIQELKGLNTEKVCYLKPFEKRFIEKLKKARNALEHHEFSGNKATVRKRLARVLLFLERFCEPLLRYKLYSQFENSDTKKEIKRLIESQEEELNECYKKRDEYIQSQKDDKELILLDCPECAASEAIVISNVISPNQNEWLCFVCEGLFPSSSCEVCGKPLIECFWEPETDTYYNVHDKCWENRFFDQARDI